MYENSLMEDGSLLDIMLCVMYEFPIFPHFESHIELTVKCSVRVAMVKLRRVLHVVKSPVEKTLCLQML